MRRRWEHKRFCGLGALCGALLLCLMAAESWGYPVGPAIPLEQLEAESDVIVKATVLSLKPATDPWFEPCPGYQVNAAKLKVISTLKGGPLPATIRFLHYRVLPRGRVAYVYAPQHYDLEIGRTYLIFADRSGQTGVFRQLWRNHTIKRDQGVFLASGIAPTDPALPLKQVVRNELAGHLAAAEPASIIYGIRQLGEMSGIAPRLFMDLHDFDPRAVEDLLAPLMRHVNHDVAGAAIRTLGAASPWMDDQQLVYYLAALDGSNSGLGAVETKAGNPGAARHWRELVAQADDRAVSPSIRALAIRALGHSGIREISGHLEPWLGDSQAEVRAAATILLADYSDPKATRLLARSVDDPTTMVRRLAALAIGCGRVAGLQDRLEGLLADNAPVVRSAAAQGLLSFPLASSRAALARHAGDPHFQSVFVNALAKENPAPWLDQLARNIEQDLQLSDFWGGQNPSFASWKILFTYLAKQPAAELQSGRYARHFKALEHPQQFWSSTEPRALYALYLARGLPERAKAFRTHCEQTFTYDIGYYFNMADQDPNPYLDVP